MEKLSELAKVLKRLDIVSKKIMVTALAVMKQVHSEDSELVDDLIDERGLGDDADRAVLLAELQDASLGWTADAENVRKEIGNFIIEDDGVYTVAAVETPDECPFLTEVWSGDSYDKTGVDGMKELLKDLEEQLVGITAENLVARASPSQIEV